jgi:hypothetical protein
MGRSRGWCRCREHVVDEVRPQGCRESLLQRLVKVDKCHGVSRDVLRVLSKTGESERKGKNFKKVPWKVPWKVLKKFRRNYYSMF